VKSWKEISGENINFDNFVSLVAHRSMKKADTFQELKKSVRKGVPDSTRYSKESYKFDLNHLVPLISEQIPPIEISHNDETHNAGTVNILNSSWDAYIQGLDEFEKASANKNEEGDFTISSKFNSFVLKSLELSDIKQSWNQASNRIAQ